MNFDERKGVCSRFSFLVIAILPNIITGLSAGVFASHCHNLVYERMQTFRLLKAISEALEGTLIVLRPFYLQIFHTSSAIMTCAYFCLYNIVANYWSVTLGYECVISTIYSRELITDESLRESRNKTPPIVNWLLVLSHLNIPIPRSPTKTESCDISIACKGAEGRVPNSSLYTIFGERSREDSMDGSFPGSQPS